MLASLDSIVRPNPRKSRSPQTPPTPPNRPDPSILANFGHRGLLVAFHGFFAPRDRPTTASGWREEAKRRQKRSEDMAGETTPLACPPPLHLQIAVARKFALLNRDGRRPGGWNRVCSAAREHGQYVQRIPMLHSPREAIIYEIK